MFTIKFYKHHHVMLRMIIHQIILLHRYKGNSNYTRSCHLRRGILHRHRGAVARIPPPARRSSAAWSVELSSRQSTRLSHQSPHSRMWPEKRMMSRRCLAPLPAACLSGHCARGRRDLGRGRETGAPAWRGAGKEAPSYHALEGRWWRKEKRRAEERLWRCGAPQLSPTTPAPTARSSPSEDGASSSCLKSAAESSSPSLSASAESTVPEVHGKQLIERAKPFQTI
jgi:hypothetical protein